MFIIKSNHPDCGWCVWGQSSTKERRQISGWSGWWSAPRGTLPLAWVLFGRLGQAGGRGSRVSASLAPPHHVAVVLDHMLKQKKVKIFTRTFCHFIMLDFQTLHYWQLNVYITYERFHHLKATRTLHRHHNNLWEGIAARFRIWS